jgi:hypothetical protein
MQQFERQIMEPEQRDDRHRADTRHTRQRSEPDVEQAVVTPPLASEGLEQVRDSHC